MNVDVIDPRLLHNVDVIDPRLLHFSQRVCDDDEDECMLNIGHTSSVSV